MARRRRVHVSVQSLPAARRLTWSSRWGQFAVQLDRAMQPVHLLDIAVSVAFSAHGITDRRPGQPA
jgi:hypothetical protein